MQEFLIDVNVLLGSTVQPQAQPVGQAATNKPPQIQIPPELTSMFSQEKVDKVIGKMIRETGVEFSILYQCCIKSCQIKFENSQELLGHLKLHRDVPFYECAHCKKKFICAINYKNHLVEHSVKRFFCFYCFNRESTRVKIDDHMTQVHKIYDLVSWPANAKKKDLQKDVFVIAPKTITAEQYINFLQKFIQMDQYNENVVNSQKTCFKSNEIDFLPTSAIFTNPLSCETCGYSTKVRTNLLRHLKMMCSGKTEQPNPSTDAAKESTSSEAVLKFAISDPVNPVPCLELNDRHYDKMSNLACDAYEEVLKNSSSTSKVIHSRDTMDVDEMIEYDSGNENDLEIIDDAAISKNIQNQPKNMWPKFVPVPKRYSCNAQGCKYQSVDDDLLKQHLKTFHGDEKVYKCPHCEIVLCFAMDFDNIVYHMKLHGETLFKCSVCSKCHFDYQLLHTHVKESHIKDDPTATTLTLRNFSSAPVEVEFVQTNTKKKNEVSFLKPPNWTCEMCHFECNTRAEMTNHMGNQHNTRQQYKCSHCDYLANNLKMFEKHFAQSHANVENLKVLFMFQQMNSFRPTTDLPLASICTQPLWSRNMQKVKHIRGILFDENESKNTAQPMIKKRRMTTHESLLKPVQTPLEKLKGIRNIFKDIMFTCYHCKKFYNDGLENLTRHWNIRHKNPILTSNSIVYPGKPFQFYIQKIVSCFYCEFSSVYDEVKSHLTISHSNMPHIITDKLKDNKCGLCKFVVDNVSELVTHFQVEHGNRFDPSKDDFGPTDNLTDSLVDSILEATNLLYVCKKCEEFKSCILPDVENHMITSHGMTKDDGFQYFYETQSVDLKVDAMKTMTYECHYNITESTLCRKFLKNFDQLVDHIYEHFLHRQFMCIFCESFGGTLEILCSHYKKEHPEYFTRMISQTEEFKFRKPKNLPAEFSNYRMHFVNGFVVKFCDAYNIKYSPKEMIMTEIENRNQRSLEEFKRTQPFSGVKLVTWEGETIECSYNKSAPPTPFLRIETVAEGIDDSLLVPAQEQGSSTEKVTDEINYEQIYVWNDDDEKISFREFTSLYNVLPVIKLKRCDDVDAKEDVRDSTPECQIVPLAIEDKSVNKNPADFTLKLEDAQSSDELVIDESPALNGPTMLKKLLLEDFVDPRLCRNDEPKPSTSTSTLRELLRKGSNKPDPIKIDITYDDDIIILD